MSASAACTRSRGVKEMQEGRLRSLTVRKQAQLSNSSRQGHHRMAVPANRTAMQPCTPAPLLVWPAPLPAVPPGAAHDAPAAPPPCARRTLERRKRKLSALTSTLRLLRHLWRHSRLLAGGCITRQQTRLCHRFSATCQTVRKKQDPAGTR